MKIRVSDYIANHLQEIGVRSVFMLSGGGMMHLIDAVGRKEQIRYYCNHHEQASAMAAEGYARITNQLGVCYATSGPGATNVLTGLTGAWVDSAPVLFLTGQSNVHQSIEGTGLSNLRQYGTFEVNIVPIVKPVTKYAVFLQDPARIRYELEKAIYYALSGRPGPVLIDIPLNIQGALIDPELLEAFPLPGAETALPPQTFKHVLEKIQAAERPVILAGAGVRGAGAVEEFRQLAERLGIPVLTTQLGKDCMVYSSERFIGHPGVKGDRAGNLAVQHADLILSLGCSLHAQTTGYEVDQFAPAAYKIQVDVDEAVLAREQVGVQEKIVCDVLSFLQGLAEQLPSDWSAAHCMGWNRQCLQWKQRYEVIQEPHNLEGELVNFYEFADVLSELTSGDERVVTDAGSAFYVMGQAFKLKGEQRYVVSGGLGAMGYALPASLGIATVEPNFPTLCVTGDGSLQTNIQELQTIRHYNLNVKIFIINNEGYVSIRNTQNSFFSGFLVGTDKSNGVSLPPLNKIADAYGIPYVHCASRQQLRAAVEETLNFEGPVICEIMAQPNQQIIPTVTSVRLDNGKMVSKPLHEMFPFLPEQQSNINEK